MIPTGSFTTSLMIWAKRAISSRSIPTGRKEWRRGWSGSGRTIGADPRRNHETSESNTNKTAQFAAATGAGDPGRKFGAACGGYADQATPRDRFGARALGCEAQRAIHRR